MTEGQDCIFYNITFKNNTVKNFGGGLVMIENKNILIDGLYLYDNKA